MTVKVTVLDNGLRVATDYMDTVETVSLGAWVAVGARDEVPELNGISHLLEHMAFKGTHRRSARAIVEEIEAVGGHLNAYTSRDNTAYFVKIMKDDLTLAVDIIADILQNSTMDEVELERERAVIIQEIHQSHDTPDDIIFDWFQEAAFPDQAMGRPVLGSADLVKGVERATLIDYMRSQYSADRMVFAAAGKVEHDRLLNWRRRRSRRCRKRSLVRLSRCCTKAASVARAGIWSRFTWFWGLRAFPITIRIITRLPSIRPFWAAACHHDYFRKCGKNEVWLIASILLRRAMRMAACSVFTPVRDPRILPN